MRRETKVLALVALGVLVFVSLLIGGLSLFAKSTIDLPDVSITGPLGTSSRTDGYGGWFIDGSSYVINSKGKTLLVVVKFVPWPGKEAQDQIIADLVPGHPLSVPVDRSVTKETHLILGKNHVFDPEVLKEQELKGTWTFVEPTSAPGSKNPVDRPLPEAPPPQEGTWSKDPESGRLIYKGPWVELTPKN